MRLRAVRGHMPHKHQRSISLLVAHRRCVVVVHVVVVASASHHPLLLVALVWAEAVAPPTHGRAALDMRQVVVAVLVWVAVVKYRGGI